MKRLAVFFLALLYLAAGTGFTLRTHYCMGQPLSAHLSHTADELGSHYCPLCGMEKNGHKGCCHDELKIFKCCTDQVPAELTQPLAPALFAIFPPAAPVLADHNSLGIAYEPVPPRPNPKYTEGPPPYLRQLII